MEPDTCTMALVHAGIMIVGVFDLFLMLSNRGICVCVCMYVCVGTSVLRVGILDQSTQYKLLKPRFIFRVRTRFESDTPLRDALSKVNLLGVHTHTHIHMSSAWGCSINQQSGSL